MKFLKHQAAHLQEGPYWTIPVLAHIKLVRQSSHFKQRIYLHKAAISSGRPKLT